MGILFSKVTSSPKEYRSSIDGIEIVCDLSQGRANLVNASSSIKGDLTLQCDRCMEYFDIKIEEDAQLILSDGEYRGNDSLDVVEFFDGQIDLKDLLESEIQSLKNDYHLCASCQDADEYEIEY